MVAAGNLLPLVRPPPRNRDAARGRCSLLLVPSCWHRIFPSAPIFAEDLSQHVEAVLAAILATLPTRSRDLEEGPAQAFQEASEDNARFFALEPLFVQT